MRVILVALASLVISGCLPHAKEIPDSSPKASISFENNESGSVTAYLYEGDKCAPGRYGGIAGVYSWLVGRSGTVPIPASQAVHVKLWSTRSGGGCVSGGGGVCIVALNCTSQTSFTPQPGKRYKAVQVMIGKG